MQAEIETDLLGDLVLTVINGGLRSRRGRIRHYAAPDLAAAEKRLADLHKRRIRRGYTLADPGPAPASG